MAKKSKAKKNIDAITKSPVSSIVNILVWLTGVLVSLAVGFGMVSGDLSIPYIETIVPFFGWVVVGLTLLSVILAILDKL